MAQIYLTMDPSLDRVLFLMFIVIIVLADIDVFKIIFFYNRESAIFETYNCSISLSFLLLRMSAVFHLWNDRGRLIAVSVILYLNILCLQNELNFGAKFDNNNKV